MRMTNQREVILRELRSSKKHLSADELYELVKKDMPRISLATVYRNLEILSEAGMIKKLEISGRQKRFDYDIEEHDHIYCVECHRVDNLDMSSRQIYSKDDLSEKSGYSVMGYRLEFTGVCPACKKKKRSAEQ